MALGGLVLIAILIALLVDRTFFQGSSSPTGTGSGVAATQARSLPPFTGVELAGDNNVVVQVGAGQSVIVHADSNLLGRVTTRVRAGRLVIGTTPGNLSAKTPMFVAVSLPSLDRLTLQGDGNIAVSGIKSQKLTVGLPGSGNIEATGTTTKLDVTISGEGTALLRQLIARDAKTDSQRRRHHHDHRDAQSQREAPGTGTVLVRRQPVARHPDDHRDRDDQPRISTRACSVGPRGRAMRCHDAKHMREAPQSRLVLIAGGGVAALEAVLALEDLAGARVRMELLTPADEFVFRPLMVGEPFDRTEARSVPLRDLLAGRPVRHVRDGLAAVDAAAGRVHTTSGTDRDYDALVVATRRPQRRVGAWRADVRRSGLRQRLPESAGGPRVGARRRVVRARPRSRLGGPVYELALLTAAHLSERGTFAGRRRSSRRSECRSPRSASRPAATSPICWSAVASRLRTGVEPREATDGVLLLTNGDAVPADRVVALPRPQGPRIAGLRAGPEGFVPVHEYGRVRGLEHVYAAGDVDRLSAEAGRACEPAGGCRRRRDRGLGRRAGAAGAVRAAVARAAADRRSSRVPARGERGLG